MLHKLRSLLALACGLVMAAVTTACHHDDEPADETSPQHTLLIYMAGDNSLADYCNLNIRQSVAGMLAGQCKDLNLVIYKDQKAAQQTTVFQLRYDAQKSRVDTVMLYEAHADLDSSDPEVFAEVVRRIFTEAATPINGLLLWSHGLSWLPYNLNAYDKPAPAALADDDEPAPRHAAPRRYIGIDGSSGLDIWDIREALTTAGVHLDYIMTDACHMGTVEVAYEWRTVTDYLLAPITETMGDGFPYAKMMPLLGACQAKAQVEETLGEVFDAYYALYRSCGALTLVRSSAMDDLYQACRQVYTAHTAERADLAAMPAAVYATTQMFGRAGGLQNQYYFADLGDIVRYLTSGSVTGSGDDTADAIASIERAVVRSYASPTFSAADGNGSITIDRCCGLATSVPEFFSLMSLSAKARRLNNAYGMCEWGAMVQETK